MPGTKKCMGEKRDGGGLKGVRKRSPLAVLGNDASVGHALHAVMTDATLADSEGHATTSAGVNGAWWDGNVGYKVEGG